MNVKRGKGLAGIVASALLLGLPGAPTSAQAASSGRPSSFVVIAHIDTGINPYHEVFRDTGPLAHVHPSKYIPGYPKETPALRLTLDAPSWEEAFEADRETWENVTGGGAGKMYWIPGTKIIGAIRFSAGGTYCPDNEEITPGGPVSLSGSCPDYAILDDHGHGTMTASRMAGNKGSLCPECRIVSIEGLGVGNVKWAADQGWIDVQSNSWGFVAPDPVISLSDEVDDGDTRENLERAARTHLVYFATGNGLGGFLGFTPWPSELAATLMRNMIWVGAHDNGKMALWSVSPPHVVADGYRPLAAGNHEIEGIGPTPFACCTSTSSPYAASEGAAIILEARKLLGDHATGVRRGIVARGRPRVGTGPLSDGKLTLRELRVLVKHGAQALPTEGKHDGEVHWTGGPGTPEVLPFGPGGNPYCPGCWTLPVEWAAVPEGVPVYPFIGYGAANEFSLALIKKVLLGKAELPDRSDVDEFFETEGQVRDVIRHPEQIPP